MKEFGHLKHEIVRDAADINSQEANEDKGSDKDMHDELELAQQNMKINMNMNFGEQFVNSDDEALNQSPGKDEVGFNNQKKKFHMSTVQKKHQSMINQDFDIGALASKLDAHAEETDARE